MNQKMFCSEVELGKFLGSTDVIPNAYRAISKTSSIYQLHTTPSGIKVLAFNCLLENGDYTVRFWNGEFDLVSSENHKVIDFISTKVNPKFSINKAAVELFELRFNELSKLPNQLMNDPLIVTGQGLGGYLAILFTILHQHAVDLEESNGSKSAKRPICITFGAPLVGDEPLRRAISERPQWNSCFLNVVAKMDPIASFFSSNSLYKPFGTFLFCTDSGGHTAFEDEILVLEVLDAMASSNPRSFQLLDYRNELGSIRGKILYRGDSIFGEWYSNIPLMAGVVTQFQDIDVLDDTRSENIRTKMIKNKRKINAYEPTKKLNDMKISLTYMEWYMKTRRSEGGYYDIFKQNGKTKNEIESRTRIITHQGFLNQYWKKIVEEKDEMPQKEGAKLRKRWLYGGTNYRRIVEPLDIAIHYKRGKTNYMAVRPNHYKLLEKWSDDDNKDQNPSDKKTKAASLTQDSCFWAHVEEALISLRDLKIKDTHNIENHLKQFEVYLMDAIKDFSLSPDVFVAGSSLMKWWSDYKVFKGSPYNSEFAQYMNNQRYTEYQ